MSELARIERAARPRWRGAAMALILALAAAPLPARASPASESKALNVKGADLFKNGDFVAAAAAFEKAYALDSADFRVLRYAGRAWQEIGFHERALTLLERYYSLEPDKNAKETLLPNLEKLRKTTPQGRAAALEQATRKFPSARLDGDAAKALEALGDAESLRRAVPLWEVARLGAGDASAKQRIDEQLQRVRSRLAVLDNAAKERQALAKKADADRVEADKTAAATVAAKSHVSTMQMVLWGTGAALVAGGAALSIIGARDTQAANADAAAGKLSYDAYHTQRQSANTLYFTGIGMAVAGVGAAVAGLLVGNKPREAPRAALWLRPDGIDVAFRF